jgi:hypothetical protein
MYAGDEYLAADDDAFGPFAGDDDLDFDVSGDTIEVPAYFLGVGDEFWSETLQEFVKVVAVREYVGVAGPQLMVQDDSHEHSWHIFSGEATVKMPATMADLAPVGLDFYG